MTGATLLKSLRSVGEVTKNFAYPYVRVGVTSQLFAGRSESEREEALADRLGISIGELRKTALNSLFLLRLADPNEAEGESYTRSTHWLAGLAEARSVQSSTSIPTVHFYGYKGGQARSTVLAALAVALARDGWRVLAVDADLEAPSLDTIFAATSKNLSGTLLGLSQGVEIVQPTTVYTSSDLDSAPGGSVALVNCWPRGSTYEIDAAAFALRAALDPTILEGACKKIGDFASANSFDLVLIDHRTGISPSVLPTIASLPGPVVVAVRLDEQWYAARSFIKLLLRSFPSDPGLFVVWKPDNEDDRSFNQRTFSQKEQLLQILADAYEGDGEEELAAGDVDDHLVIWSYDEGFRNTRLPEPDMLSIQSQESVARIRSLLGFAAAKTHAGKAILNAPAQRATNISGARDQGDLIVTRALRELLAQSNPFTYILGRKGTGKTRLARELAIREIGEPLLVADDSEERRGLKSNAPEITDAALACIEEPNRFWIALFTAAMKHPTTDREVLGKAFVEQIKNPMSASDAVSLWSSSKSYRSFLLDSIETTFSSKQMVPYLHGLFTALSLIETDPRASEKVGFRLFLRRDLAQRSFIQNLEQQLYGKTLELSWDYQSILNFVLSRISVTDWFRQNFPDMIREIDSNRMLILGGELKSLECEKILELAFPTTVRRNNLRTMTFFRTYFSDSASERAPGNAPAGSDIRRYYPRVFDEFIRTIPDELKDDSGSLIPSVDEDGKVNQTRIFTAHEKAADSYLQGLKQELAYVVTLSDDFTNNQEQIDKLLNNFEGRQTPFQIDKRVREISADTSISPESVRTALDKMKDVGMFEARPDYPGEWRVGRLFKSSLRMKYVRGRRLES